MSWNSEAGHVDGTIIAVHTRDVDYKGHRQHASEAEIKSERMDHVATHKGSGLR